MKPFLLRVSFLFLAFVGFYPIIHAQTSLSKGDIAVVAVNEGPGTEAGTNLGNSFSFVCWVNLAAGTQINFTDVWFGSTGVSTGTGNANGGQPTETWTAPSGGVTAGTVVTITNVGDDPTVPTASVGAVTDAQGGSNSGGQVYIEAQGGYFFITQGATALSGYSTITGTGTFAGTILFGFLYGGAIGSTDYTTWNTISSSDLPSDLSASSNYYFSYTPDVYGGQYNGARNTQTTYSA